MNVILIVAILIEALLEIGFCSIIRAFLFAWCCFCLDGVL